MSMDASSFEKLVVQAVQGLPKDFLARLDNVDVVVEDKPSRQQLRQAGLGHSHLLLGLYEGIPQTSRNAAYSMVLPDKITVFQESVEEVCQNDAEVVEEVRRVVLHELAHHFGISDARLDELGL